MDPPGKFLVEFAASALTAVVVVAALVFLPFPRSARVANVPALATDEQTDYSLDSASIGAKTIALRWHPQPEIAFAPGDELDFAGWAIDRALRAPVTAVRAIVDGGATFAARTGIERADIAAKFRNPSLSSSGFQVRIPRCALEAGAHRVAFQFEAADGRGFFRSRDDVDIDVRASGTYPPDVAYAVDTIVPAPSIAGRHRLSGWMVDTGNCTAARAVFLSIDGRTVARAATGESRPDVARVLGSSGYARSGFVATWTDRSLTSGPHVLRLAARFDSGRAIDVGFKRIFVRRR